MAAADATLVDLDEALADLQGQLNLMFVRARSLWKESAARIHPELPPAAYKLLTFIAHAGSTSAHELADRFEMDKSMVSRQTRMLEELGLLQSRPDERDGRLRVLTATPVARDALAAVRRDNAERLRDAIAELSAEELQAASKVFRVLSEA